MEARVADETGGRPVKAIHHNSDSGWNARIDGQTAVYRLYDAVGRLLYVGISNKPERRLHEHESEKLWWHLVVDKRVSWCDSREQALIVEEEADRLERPRFGDTHRLGSGWRTSERREAPELAQGIADLAEQLRSAIADGKYRPGCKMPTARKVAQEHGVSIAMAKMAMSRLASVHGPLEGRLGGYYWVRDASAAWPREEGVR